jgi:hypothetical protein
MRFNHTSWIFIGLLLAALSGCGGSQDEPTEPAPSNPPPATEEALAPAAPKPVVVKGDTSKPEAAVAVFLEAVRSGDDAQAEAMFTPIAREKTADMDIQVAPRGSDTASFTVGKVEYVATDGARVATTWTDLDDNGNPRTDEITWMVRREPEGWRVAGMAATVFAGRPPLLLDFEKPEETLRKLEMLQEELAKAGDQGTPPADAQPAVNGPQVSAETAQMPENSSASPEGPLTR